MRVKRYVVDSMPDALQQIRAELGKDAVILNTKEIRSGGFLGLFSKKRIEVIAATDSSAPAAGAGAVRSRPAASAAGGKASAIGSMAGAQAASVAVMEQPRQTDEAKAASLLKSIGMLTKEQSREAAPQPASAAAPKPVVSASHGAALYQGYSTTPADTASVKPLPPSAITAPDDIKPAVPSATDDYVLSELRAMKQMMQKLSASGGMAPEPNPVLQELEERLLAQEVQPELVAVLLNAIEEQAADSGAELTKEWVAGVAQDQLRIMMGANARKPLQPDTKIAHFVGPTGVGKTTTIAKLAAEQVLKHRRKVGLVTSDTYRIAAVDQLKTYATILGVPLEVVFSPLDLKKALDNLQDCDIIFMDTAGRNFRNEMYVSELNALLHAGVKSETYLVLSLTMKYKDMKAVADNFSKFKLDKVLFTKKDETDTFGSIINLLHEFPLELSYITTGQNVPDDFGIANENDIIALILEGQADE